MESILKSLIESVEATFPTEKGDYVIDNVVVDFTAEGERNCSVVYHHDLVITTDVEGERDKDVLSLNDLIDEIKLKSIHDAQFQEEHEERKFLEEIEKQVLVDFCKKNKAYFDNVETFNIQTLTLRIKE
jgi:hypothetical protein